MNLSTCNLFIQVEKITKKKKEPNAEEVILGKAIVQSTKEVQLKTKNSKAIVNGGIWSES